MAGLAIARVVCSATSTYVAFFLERYPETARNWAVAEALRRHYAPLTDQYGLRVDDWHGSGANVKRDRIITQLPAGYANGDSGEVAAHAAAVLTAWATMMTEHPLPDLETLVDELAPHAADHRWESDGEQHRDLRRWPWLRRACFAHPAVAVW